MEDLQTPEDLAFENATNCYREVSSLPPIDCADTYAQARMVKEEIQDFQSHTTETRTAVLCDKIIEKIGSMLRDYETADPNKVFADSVAKRARS